MKLIKLGKPKPLALSKLVDETQAKLRGLWNILGDINHASKRLEEIDIAEERSPKIAHFKKYRNWVKKEFKIERKIMNAVAEIIHFEKELNRIENSLEKSIGRDVFESYPNLRRNYNDALKREISKLKHIEDKFVREVAESRVELANENRFESLFPEIKQEIHLKNQILYQQALKLYDALVEIRTINSLIRKQEEATE